MPDSEIMVDFNIRRVLALLPSDHIKAVTCSESNNFGISITVLIKADLINSN